MVMYLLMHIYIYILKIIYFFLKLMPTRNKIVFLSRQSNSPSLDFKRLEEEIRKIDENIEIVYVTKRIVKSKLEVLKGFGSILKSMKHLATSKVCITDGYNIAISNLKHKKDLKVFQMWHSLAAIKKFGYQTLNTEKDKKIAKIMNMHKGYDFINCSSVYMKKYFKEAFNCEEEKLVPLGLPRIDYLINEEKIIKKRIYSKYPEFKKKKVILYAPTFRESNNYKIDKLIKAIDLNKYFLIVKEHPNMKVAIKNKNVYTCDDFKALSLITVSDYIITDYSAITIEAATVKKPVYIYAYDLDEYKKENGLNIDLEEELKGCVFKDEKDLISAINKSKYNKEILNEIKNKYLVSTKGDITEKVAKFILDKGVNYEKKN